MYLNIKIQKLILIHFYFLNEHVLDKVSGEDPMLPFHQYYDQANYNYDSFIQIR